MIFFRQSQKAPEAYNRKHDVVRLFVEHDIRNLTDLISLAALTLVPITLFARMADVWPEIVVMMGYPA
jgi:hypothetical protein